MRKYRSRWGCYEHVWKNLSCDAWRDPGAKADDLSAAAMGELWPCHTWGAWMEAPYANWICAQRDRELYKLLNAGPLRRRPDYMPTQACR